MFYLLLIFYETLTYKSWVVIAVLRLTNNRKENCSKVTDIQRSIYNDQCVDLKNKTVSS